MNHSRLLLISLLFATTAFAQTPPDDGHDADRAALRELGRQYEQAINGGNLLALAPSVAKEASAVFVTNDEVQGIEAMQKYLEAIQQRLGKGSAYTVKLDPDSTEFFGDLALAHGRSHENAKLASGRVYEFTTRWTAILRKDGAGWKAQRLHVSMDPFDNPIISTRLQMRTWATAGIGVVLAILTFGLGMMIRRRASS